MTMGVFGIGIDVVDVERIASAIARHGEPFLAKIFTPDERAYCDAMKSPAMHYAARFAAKEAVSKSLGTGIGARAGLHDLEVVSGPGGAPSLRLSGAAAEFARTHGIAEIKISLSHDRLSAVANAIALTAD